MQGRGLYPRRSMSGTGQCTILPKFLELWSHMLEFTGLTARHTVNSRHIQYAVGSVMTFRFSAPVYLAGITVLFCANASWAQAPVGAERIIAAETRAAALEAQNQQLKNTIETQTAALKRLDQEISLAKQEQTLQRQKDAQATRILQERISELQQQAEEQARTIQALQLEANRMRAESAQASAALKDAEDALVNAEQARGEALQAAVAQREAVEQQLGGENERVKQQLAYVLERNETLQQALSEATSSGELQAMQRANEELRSQLSILQDRNSELQQALAARSEQDQAEAGRVQAEYAALQQEYNAALDGIRSCEARLRDSASSHQASAGDARVAELEGALNRANREIRSLNESHQRELQTERAMAAGSEAALEQQYTQQIAQLQQALKTCQAQ